MNYPWQVGCTLSHNMATCAVLLKIYKRWRQHGPTGHRQTRCCQAASQLPRPWLSCPRERCLQHPAVASATLPQRDTRELPSEATHPHFCQAPLPRGIQLSFYLHTPSFMQFLSLSSQDLLIRISLAHPKLVLYRRGKEKLSVEAICTAEHVISPVNACIWPGFLGLLYRAVDAVQSTLLSVPDKMAIKDWVRGHSPKAISTPK